VSEKTLQQLYKKSLGLVFPSLSGPDNLPPLESLALGKPVIQADFPGTREQLGETVDYANAFKEEDWAQAMIQLINSPKSTHGSARKDAIASLLKNRTTSGYISQIRNILTELVALVRCWS
jgi:glycosyltransferase involved in cell wall biosynthesis